MIAVWMLGATAVPIDFRTRERGMLARQFDLAGILEDRQSGTPSYQSLLIDDSWSNVVPETRFRSLLDER